MARELTDEQVAAIVAASPPLEGEARARMRTLLAGNVARQEQESGATATPREGER